MQQRSEKGFSLIEVTMAAAMIGLTLFGMSGVLLSYSKAQTGTNGLALAQSIVQAELDEVLTHQQVENSLVSDSKGRARPIYIKDLDLLVSAFYYYNFPNFKTNQDHNTQGMLWDEADPAFTTRFDDPPGRRFDLGGKLMSTTEPVKDDPSVAYIARMQIYGANDDVQDVENYINGNITASYPNGEYLDSDTIPGYLVADTCKNDGNTHYVTEVPYRQKIVVVRVYSRQSFLAGGAISGSTYSFMNAAGGAKKELAHGYAVVNGKIRL